MEQKATASVEQKPYFFAVELQCTSKILAMMVKKKKTIFY